MHILIAPDSFKESLSAVDVARNLHIGFSRSLPEASFDLMPVGDGGEGTLAALSDGLTLEKQTVKVTGALGQAVSAPYAANKSLAVFEMADICGLEKVPLEHRQPMELTTRGVGEMLLHLAQIGMTEIMVGVGGSATNDGGIGMAAGLGVQFLDDKNRLLPAVGASLEQIRTLVAPRQSPLKDVNITIITDVDNPLCGRKGAAYIFGLQKGLKEQELASADRAMHNFYQLVNPDLIDLSGSGAGGGMAAGLIAFAGGRICSGIDTVLDLLDFNHRVKKADLVIVGEGRLDRQSLAGKAPIGVARRTPPSIPVLAVCGSLADDLPDFPFENIQAAFSIIPGVDSLENTLASADKNLIRTAQNIGNLLKLTV
ncbi:glycerate kinase [Streptococcus chenjunshii]|uniref:Glycerate kinase n=1 Tax=Streptococcus chenjunshii TaxID=2173853 RepID=A0A372KMU6_9STRE|nr:glycerate kinase [Streptococcus chenjunshii]AXQ78966.1 glycerate kinase [Streptococcus chenjunshii]RFU51393.1 glycerate kinase [Streptococcus chenjunshii]RFU53593.1 glycerate kinase [Streptococcus chenjunshii]